MALLDCESQVHDVAVRPSCFRSDQPRVTKGSSLCPIAWQIPGVGQPSSIRLLSKVHGNWSAGYPCHTYPPWLHARVVSWSLVVRGILALRDVSNKSPDRAGSPFALKFWFGAFVSSISFVHWLHTLSVALDQGILGCVNGNGSC